MDSRGTELLIEVIVQSGVVFLLLGTFVALVVGVLLLIAPERVVAFKQYSDRWLTIRKHTKVLEVQRHHDPFFYHHHRAVGSLIIVGASYVLYRMAFDALGTLTPDMVDLPERLIFWQWLYDAGITFLTIGSFFALWVGGIIFFRPSLLKGIEQQANRWLSSRQALRRTDQNYTGFEAVLIRYHWVSGLILIFGAVYTWWLLLGFVLNHQNWLAILTDWLY